MNCPLLRDNGLHLALLLLQQLHDAKLRTQPIPGMECDDCERTCGAECMEASRRRQRPLPVVVEPLLSVVNVAVEIVGEEAYGCRQREVENRDLKLVI